MFSDSSYIALGGEVVGGVAMGHHRGIKIDVDGGVRSLFGKQPLKNFVDEQSDFGPGSQGVC